MQCLAEERLVGLKGPDGMQDDFDLLAAKVDMMTVDETAEVVVVPSGSLEHEVVSLCGGCQEFDVRRRHIGTLIRGLVAGFCEKCVSTATRGVASLERAWSPEGAQKDEDDFGLTYTVWKQNGLLAV